MFQISLIPGSFFPRKRVAKMIFNESPGREAHIASISSGNIPPARMENAVFFIFQPFNQVTQGLWSENEGQKSADKELG
jgi:hypothetical protein